MNMKKVDDLTVGNHWIIYFFYFFFYFYFLSSPIFLSKHSLLNFTIPLYNNYGFFDICLWVLYHKISGFFLLFPTSYSLPQFRFLILWENIEQPLSILFFKENYMLFLYWVLLWRGPYVGFGNMDEDVWVWVMLEDVRWVCLFVGIWSMWDVICLVVRKVKLFFAWGRNW